MSSLLLVLASIFLIAVPGLCGELYPCHDPAGRLFVTDDPAHLPSGCVLLGAPLVQGSFSVVPSPPLSKSPAARGAMSALSRSGQQQRAQERIWKQRAESLLNQYRQGVREVYRTGRSRDRQRVREQLKELKDKKRVLMVEVRQSGRQSVRREIGELLSVIPD